MNKYHERSRRNPPDDAEHSEHRLKQLQIQLLTLSQSKAMNRQRAQVMGQIATIYWRLHKIEASVHMWQQVLSFTEEERDDFLTLIAYMALATIYGQNGKIDEAFNYANLALEQDADFPDVVMTMGNTYNYADNDEAAIEWWDRAVELDEEFTIAHESLGCLHAQRREYEKAHFYFDKVLVLNPESISIYLSLGNMYITQGYYKKALAEYKKAIKADPTEGLPYNNLGNCYLRMGDLDKARRSFKKGIEADPEEALWPSVGMGIVYRSLPNKKAHAKSVEFFQQGLALHKIGKARLQSGRLEFDSRRAMAWMGLGDERAISAWQKILSLSNPKLLKYSSLLDCIYSVKFLAECKYPPPDAAEILALLEAELQRRQDDQ